MPNKRRAGQTFIGIQMDIGLASELDRARGRKDRSQFVREAIAEKLKRMKIRVPESLIYPPPRAQSIQSTESGSGELRQSMSAEEPERHKIKRKKKRIRKPGTEEVRAPKPI